jgi:8-oxo-dGTP diphosphatase
MNMNCDAPRALLLVVAAAMIDQNNQVLVQLRPANVSMAGLWEFPGGKVEAGESPQVALCRELKEELGVDVDAADLTPLTFASEPLSERNLLLLLFECRKWRGDAAALHADEVKWIDPECLETLSMPPADQPFIGVIKALVAPAEIAQS